MRSPLNSSPGPRLLVRRLRYAQLLEWLQRGWLDLADCPWPGLRYGAAATALAAAGAWLAQAHFWLLVGVFSATVLLAPLLAARLQAISRALELGDEPAQAQRTSSWGLRDRRIWRVALLFSALGALWAAGCGWAIAHGEPTPHRLLWPLEPLDYLYGMARRAEFWPLGAWLLSGLLLAAPIFVFALVAMPLVLDSPASVGQALRTGWRALEASPGPVALWGASLLVLTVLGAVTLLLGLVITIPWLAHASWHAYRDMVDRDDSVADTAPASQRWRATVRASRRQSRRSNRR